MTIRDKIRKKDIEEKRQEVIEKGGQVYTSKKKYEWLNFCLRIRKDMLKNIEKCVEERVGITKTGWILEAIHDKLNKETKN